MLEQIYWMVPLFSALVWLSMLLAMLLTWITDGKPRLASMNANQSIAYISDVGATNLKPLFIAMSAVTVVTFDLSFIFERWLRHKGVLAPNTSWIQKALNIVATIAAIAGAAGIILLAIFDTLRHPRLHNGFLVLFIGGYIVCAIFICAEYQRLGIHFREKRILRVSFWIKLTFIIVEVLLCIAFGVLGRYEYYNQAAIVEWVIALIYTFFVASFFLDFVPAVRSKHHQSGESALDMAEREDEQSAPSMQQDHAASAPRGRFYGNGHTNGHAVNGANGYTNGNGTNGNGLINGVNYK